MLLLLSGYVLLPERWLQDSRKKRKPPGFSQPSVFLMNLLSSSSLRYISSQLEKMKSKLKKIKMDLYCRPGTFMSSCLMNSLSTKIKSIQQCLDLCPSIQHTQPVLGQIQLCDVCLEEGSVAVVTVALPVLLHKAFHEIHSSNVLGFGQQVAGVTATETHRNTCC